MALPAAHVVYETFGLGDDPRCPTFIETIRGRGYRFLGGIQIVEQTASSALEPSSSTEVPALAALPFANLSDDPDQEYLSDGITEDIITELSKFSELSVIARNSAFTFKNRPADITQIASELGVNYVMEGSIQRNKNRLRVTAKLVETDSGRHIWGEKYDRELKDIFELQDDIAMHVVGSIAPQVELAELQRSRKLSNTNLSAYELALKAQALTYDAVRVADRDMLNQAMLIADKALELEKMCTHALWTRGMGCVLQYLYGWSTNPGSALNFAIEIADHLIGIDPSNAKSYIVRAWAYQYRREYDLALADYRRALELNPNLALNLFTMAWSEAVAGLPTEARQHAKRALMLSPRDTDIWLAWAYATLELASFIESDFSDAVKWGRLAIQLHARMPVRQLVMIAGYGYLGDVAAASSHAAAIGAFAPETLSAVLAGNYQIFKLSEHNSLLLEGLHQAGL
jgi:TolB-like protein